VDSNKYNPGPQYRKLWATLDIKKANEMLDKIGLAKKDAEGYRLRGDGKGRLRIEMTPAASSCSTRRRRDDPRAVKRSASTPGGEVERSLAIKAGRQRDAAQRLNNDGSEHLFTSRPTCSLHGRRRRHLRRSTRRVPLRGTRAEPEPRMKELMDKWKKAFGVPEKERIQLARTSADRRRGGLRHRHRRPGSGGHGRACGEEQHGNIPSRTNSPDGKTPGMAAGDVLLEELTAMGRHGSRT
jgi:peptide/nickel transport system substrate-binding protein